MPRGHIIPTQDVTYEQLLDRLKSEWGQPDPSVAEPIIIETVDRLRPQQVPTHLYVIWSEWEDLPSRRRSEMIMDAYESVKGRTWALNVTLAMGLTPEEAQRLGIRYETEAAATPA